MTACLSMFVAFKCLCLPLIRRCWGGEVEDPLFCPLISKQEAKMLKERARKETVRRRNEGCQGMRKDLVFQIQLLRSRGYSAPLPPPHRPCFPLLCGCNQKGQIKGGGRVSLQHFSSQSCQSVAKSGALGGVLTPLHHDEG